MLSRRVVGNWPTNSTTVALSDVSSLVLGRSGLSDLTDYGAAEALTIGITNLGGTNFCTLSKPLPKALTNSQSVGMATLKYRPFSAPGSADYLETIVGWQRYAGTVAKFAADTPVRGSPTRTSSTASPTATSSAPTARAAKAPIRRKPPPQRAPQRGSSRRARDGDSSTTARTRAPPGAPRTSMTLAGTAASPALATVATAKSPP